MSECECVCVCVLMQVRTNVLTSSPPVEIS